jgi:hypothetical protein
MARLFVFGIGGTGSRVMKSLTMLLAAGLKPGNFDEVIPILIDPHKDLKELNECKKLIRLYAQIQEKTSQGKENNAKGFFSTKITTLKSAASDRTLKDDFEFDERHNEAFGDFINKTGIRRISPSTLDLLTLLYSDKNFEQPLSVGFKGNPHMGSVVLNALIGGPAYNAFKSIFGNGDRIFIISSVFGGTGAAGFPLLLENFRQSDKPEIKSAQIGALSIMPYFKLSEAKETSDIDSNDFITKTKSALSYYTRQDFSSLYNSIYYLADPDKQTTPYKNDEQKQDNQAHIVELLGALSIFHFAENTFTKGEVHEFCIGDEKENVHFKNVGNVARDSFASNLTALHLLSKVHFLIKGKSKALSFCKVNGFDPDFFNETYFTDEEGGLEKFFNVYYKNWIIELESNQRSFSPFNLLAEKSLNTLVRRFEKERHFLDGILTRPTDVTDLLNKVSATVTDKEVRIMDSNPQGQYLTMCWKGTNKFLDTKIKIRENGKS